MSVRVDGGTLAMAEMRASDSPSHRCTVAAAWRIQWRGPWHTARHRTTGAEHDLYQRLDCTVRQLPAVDGTTLVKVSPLGHSYTPWLIIGGPMKSMPGLRLPLADTEEDVYE